MDDKKSSTKGSIKSRNYRTKSQRSSIKIDPGEVNIIEMGKNNSSPAKKTVATASTER